MKFLERINQFFLSFFLGMLACTTLMFGYWKYEEMKAKVKFYERAKIDIRINHIHDLFDDNLIYLHTDAMFDEICGT